MTWWSTLYDDFLADQLLTRDEKDIAPTVAFLTQRLALSPGSRLLDQCCGTGTFSLPLAAAGVRVTGVDQASSYIERATAAAKARGLDTSFVTGDARVFIAPTPVDAAFNWGTSFGYLETDDENLVMLSRAKDSLRPGGRFALDTMNVPAVLRAFQRDVVVRRQTSRGEVVLLRETGIDLSRGVMKKRWTYYVDGQKATEHSSEFRMYMPDAVVGLLGRAGFVDVELLGSIDGEPLGLDSPRIIALARRPS